MMADALFDALTTRLDRFIEGGDPSGLLEPGAVEETARLWRLYMQAGPVPKSRWDVLAVVANLYLGRCQVLPEKDGMEDVQVTMAFCSVLAVAHPDAIPEPV